MNVQAIVRSYEQELQHATLEALPVRNTCFVIQGWPNQYTGYGHYAWQAASCFDDWGYQVAYSPIGEMEGATPVLERCLKREKKGPVLVIQPTSYPFIEADYWYTMHETTTLPRQAINALNRVGAVIVPTAWSATCFLAQGVTRPIHICPLGVDLDLFSYTQAKDNLCIFGAAGNTSLSVAYRKNIELAVMAFSRAFPTERDVELRVKLLPSCVPPKTTDPRIKITQAIFSEADMARWMQELTAFVLPSRGEGFGLFALQAMSCGKPVLAAPFAGVNDFFNASNGYAVAYDLVTPKGCYNELGVWAEPKLGSMIEQMRCVYKDRQTAQSKGKLARASAERFSWFRSHTKLEHLILDAAAKQEAEKPVQIVDSSDLNDLTVAITSFKRSSHLKRAIESCLQAGVRNIVVASMLPDNEVLRTVQPYRHKPGFCFTSMDVDLGCNELWLQAAYRSATQNVLILHDDDFLAPRFGLSYKETIAPWIRMGAMVTWRGRVVWDDGRERATEYWHGPTRDMDSVLLERFLLQRNRLSLSPVVTVFKRDVLIRALKEAAQFLTTPDSWLHPGMLLGTELVAYFRHCQAHQYWHYVDEVLSFYGAHMGSGTVAAEQSGDLSVLCRGYDLARSHFEANRDRQWNPEPRIILVYSDFTPHDEDEAKRCADAMASWRFHFEQGTLLDFPLAHGHLKRSSADLGDPRPVPYFNDILNWSCQFACQEDVVVYINRDVGITTTAPEKIIASVRRVNGATTAIRRDTVVQSGRLYRSVLNCKPDGGFDAMCVTPDWWAKNKDRMPLMFIGREAFDTVFRTILEQDYTGCKSPTADLPPDFLSRPYYVDDVIYHQTHPSYWKEKNVKLENRAQVHNRKMARMFFETQDNEAAVAWYSEGCPPQRICVATICRNQRDMMPFFLRHYETFADRIYVWDDHSDDGTRELLQAHPKVVLQAWPHPSGIDEDLFLQHTYDTYPSFVGQFDWVMWVDTDEFIYAPNMQTALRRAEDENAEVVLTQGYNMVSEGLPVDDGRQLWEQIRTGVPSDDYSKLVVFKPTAKLRWAYGKHRLLDCAPLVTRKPLVKLLHYRYLGAAYTERRNANNYGRCSQQTLDKNLAWSCSPENTGKHSAQWAEAQKEAAANVV